VCEQTNTNEHETCSRTPFANENLHEPLWFSLVMGPGWLSTAVLLLLVRASGGTPGGCAFVGYHSDATEDFVILMLQTLGANEDLFVTDIAWDEVASSFREEGSEGVHRCSRPGDVVIGSILRFSDFTTLSSLIRLTATDSLHVYTGNESSPSFLCSLTSHSYLVRTLVTRSGAYHGTPAHVCQWNDHRCGRVRRLHPQTIKTRTCRAT
jgi:hypothetical protein